MCGIDYQSARSMAIDEASLFFEEIAKLKNPGKSAGNKTYRVRS